MTKRSHAMMAVLAVAVSACDAPTRLIAASRQIHTIASDTTIVAGYAGVTERRSI